MKKRFITSIFIFLATALAIISKLLPYNIGTYIFDIFIILVSVVAGFEISNIMDNTNKKNNKLLVSLYPIFYFAVFLICLSNLLDFSLILIIELLALVVYYILSVIVDAIRDKEKNFSALMSQAFNTIVGCMYPSFWLCLMININHMDVFAGQYFSLIFIIMIVAVTMLTDTFAYLVGCKLRGPKLAPKISPNKTISGAIGGLFGGIIGAMLLYLIVTKIPSLSSVIVMHGISWWHFLMIGIFGSAIGQAGDLFESKLKRNAGIKDSGNIFPGHGGMLDRIDAMIFVTIFVYICLTLIIM